MRLGQNVEMVRSDDDARGTGRMEGGENVRETKGYDRIWYFTDGRGPTPRNETKLNERKGGGRGEE